MRKTCWKRLSRTSDQQQQP